MSVLRTEARRTIAPWLVFVLLAVGLGFFFLFSGPWWKNASAWDLQWTPSILWSRYLLSLLWPIIVCGAALQGMRDRRSGMEELLATTPLPVARRTAKIGLVIGLSAVAGYLVIVAVGLGQVIANDGMFTFTWVLPLLVGVASVVAGAAVGLAVGRLLPHPLTAPAAGVVALVVGVFLQVGGVRGSAVQQTVPNRIALLSPAGGQPYSAFVDPVVSVSVGQLCWLLGLAATGFLVLAVRRWFAVLPALVGLAVAIPIFPATVTDNFVDNPSAAAPVCEGSVCVTTLHADWLSTVSGPGKDALALLAKLPSAPTRVVETTTPENIAHGPGDPSALVVRRDDSELRDVSGRDLEYELLATAPFCSGPPTATKARYIIAAWLLGDPGDPPHAGVYGSWLTTPMHDVGAQLRALPAAEQLARVSAAYQAQQTCSGDPYALLTGASR
ncbi:hypothetical protein AB0K15_13385 [Amycolatopsis sp. NPDC049253]|uniref:hypothetical protein n=1 Tax=Amycolatopsis sp. NPDC049253 TaxID=3155274 RepID=UPI003447B9E5